MKHKQEAKVPNDFDFYVGSWRVRHTRLKSRLTNCTEWEEFEGTTVVYKTLGGFGNVDDNWLDLPEGPYRAVSIRAYDTQTRSWSIWWLDSRRPNTLDVPVVGTFENDIGTFLAQDTLDGRPILVRFSWDKRQPQTPKWEQAFSPDNGATWETNWVMSFFPSHT
jgi:hypothetical protein